MYLSPDTSPSPASSEDAAARDWQLRTRHTEENLPGSLPMLALLPPPLSCPDALLSLRLP